MSRIKFKTLLTLMMTSTLVLQMMLFYSNQCHSSMDEDAQELLSESKSPKDVQTPNDVVANFTRTKRIHGNDIQNDRNPGTQFSSIKRRLTIGIPTIRRRDGSYISEMLESMLNKISDSDIKEIIFVIFLADLNNTEWKSKIETEIKRNYWKYIASGSLQIIQASRLFYEEMFQYANNSYMNWRIKQNYDYAYLMRYCEHLSEFYMQMEDDVQASDGYYSAIIDFIEQQENDQWICLEFSELGFIGKLYHSKHIRRLSDMLLIFCQTQPVDYTYIYFNRLFHDGPRKLRKPTLFQHMGIHSSLPDKIQPLRDSYFDFSTKVWKGDNPPAQIFTTLNVLGDFTADLPYSSEPGHFWSKGPPEINDTYSLIFKSVHSIKQIVIVTGSRDHPHDIIRHGILEVGAVVSDITENPVCEELVTLEHFEDGKINIDVRTMQSKLDKIRCIQIRFTEGQNEWVIIREIAVFLMT